MESVHITKCDSYEYIQAEQAVYACLNGLSDIKSRLGNSPKVLVKVNLLKKNSPEDAVTTHPAVAEAVVRYLQSLGCKVVIGDSPGGPYNEKVLRSVYKVSGMADVAERTGCGLNYDTSVVEVVNGKAKRLKNMQVIKVLEDVDFVVSVAKLKTHGMMTYTGAVKNLFGVIPGLIKAEYHFKMKSTENFAHHLIDICEYVKPVFSVIDAVEGMEGDGPSAGEKRSVGLILASSNPYALDTAAVHIMGIDPFSVPTIKVARERGIFSGEIKDLCIQGVPLGELDIPPFKLPGSMNINFVGGKVPKRIEDFLVNTFRAKPVFHYELCINCGDCKRGCPAGIIDMSGGKPVPDLNKCISCFCCHELCPKKAIGIQKPWLHRMLFRTNKK